MNHPDDETLMAYADGALDPERAREVELWLEKDGAAAKTVEAFRRTKTLVRDAFDRPMHERPPQSLIDAILDTPVADRAERTIVPLRPAKNRWRGGLSQFAAPMALAASVALAVGLGLGVFFAGGGREGTGQSIALGALPTSHPVAAALTRLTSGASVPLGGGLAGRSVTIIATFLDASRRPCREFEMTGADAGAPQTVAIACREGAAWRVDGAVQFGAAPQRGTGGFTPAGSERADPLAGLIAQLGAGGALGPDQEAALIARNWSQPAE